MFGVSVCKCKWPWDGRPKGGMVCEELEKCLCHSDRCLSITLPPGIILHPALSTRSLTNYSHVILSAQANSIDCPLIGSELTNPWNFIRFT